ncbi:MAG TPA: cellulase family glycosylhydrolase [Polyangiaceae bacterium]|nr:cellulase family glycosylhydrolase [Polyangiaceae bacterium]
MLRPWLLAVVTATLLSACYTSSGTQPSHACTLAPPSPPDWRLVADGTLLRDGLGRVVFLRGVDAGGRSKLTPYVPFDYAPGQYEPALGAYLDRAASWGIDAMRVPFTWAALEPAEGQDDADWLSRYEELLAAAWARGIWTVVDFHQDVYAETFCGDGFPAWTLPDAPSLQHTCPNPEWQLEYFGDTDVEKAFDAFWAPGSPVQAGYVAAWDRMIARFQNQPGVVGFEPINEPAAGSAKETTFEATTLTAFFSAIVPHFRSLAPRSLVFVDAPGVDSVGATTAMTLPAGDGIVFAPHYYPITNANPSVALPGIQSWASVGAQWNVPVFLGEFGVSHDNDGAFDYITAHFAALDTLGMSGTEWEYSVSAESWNAESDGVVAADGTEYPVAQALVRPFARAVAGDSIAQSWDPDAGTFTLSYAPSASAATGITEVQLPARAFAGGVDVSLSSGCYDATSVPGRMLVQPGAGATQVTLTIAPR